MTNLEKIQLCQEIVDEIQSRNRRPVCRLRFGPPPFALTDSHLGGTPYLPRDAAYPMGDAGQPLWLCAQINFAQLPPMEDFPTSGILQFYLSDWRFDGGFGLYSGDIGLCQDQWRVLYHPTIDNSVSESDCRAKMPIPWESADSEHMGRPKNALDDPTPYDPPGPLALWRTPNRPLRMEFGSVEQEGVNDEDYRFDLLFADAVRARLPDANPKDYMPYSLDDDTPEEWEALRAIHSQAECGGCKIGGYPRYLQDDPRLYSDEAGEDLSAWDTLLFQLDGDLSSYPAGEIDDMDLNLNGGTLNFLIRREDLRRRDFSRVLAQWACT